MIHLLCLGTLNSLIPSITINYKFLYLQVRRMTKNWIHNLAIDMNTKLANFIFFFKPKPLFVSCYLNFFISFCSIMIFTLRKKNITAGSHTWLIPNVILNTSFANSNNILWKFWICCFFPKFSTDCPVL